MSRELRDFVPVVPGRAGIYICGLTTQAPPHLGHVRFAVAFDVLRRASQRQNRKLHDIAEELVARTSQASAELSAPAAR